MHMSENGPSPSLLLLSPTGEFIKYIYYNNYCCSCPNLNVSFPYGWGKITNNDPLPLPLLVSLFFSLTHDSFVQNTEHKQASQIYKLLLMLLPYASQDAN